MPRKQHIPKTLRQQVRERAGSRCEYCRMHESDAMYPYEADHVVAEKHGGATVLDNLAWACGMCNRRKGTDLASVDPRTGRIVELYSPRRQQWRRHFRVNGGRIEGLTASGRATVVLLHMNEQWRIEERAALLSIGHYPRE